MSGLQPTGERPCNGVDVREQGNALRVATNTPHLVSLGTGRLSTAVTLHPIKQGRVTIGTDPTCDIHVAGTGVSNVHCRVENSHGVVTLYPINGSTLLDGLPVETPTRLSQGSMLTIGRSNYLRFNHPEEAKLMKSVLPSGHISMAPIQFQPNEDCMVPQSEFTSHSLPNNQYYQSYHNRMYKDNNPLSSLDHELDLSLKEFNRKRPPAVPKRPHRDLDYSDSNSDAESQKPKISSIMAKVSKFEYYAKSQQKTIGRSQFYTSAEPANEISPKVFSSNSLTVNTPAKDVLGGKNLPTNYSVKENNQKTIINDLDPKNCSYANVAVRKPKVDDMVRNFDDTRNCEVGRRTLKKVNNDEQQNRSDGIYGKINKDRPDVGEKKLNVDSEGFAAEKTEYSYPKVANSNLNLREFSTPSPSFNRNPEYVPVYNPPSHIDRSTEAETKRVQAYQNRIKEEEQKHAETARLEEILSMCAEYEKQIASGIPITPTEKRSQNKIITNGSLPRSVVLNHPNIVQTSDGYYKFDTSHNRNISLSTSLPIHRNLSSYENFDVTQTSQPSNTEPTLTPEVTIRHRNVGRMDEIGIPVFEDGDSPKSYPIAELSSPILIRKIRNAQQNGELPKIPLNLNSSPVGSPYDNVYLGRNNVYGNMKPKSPSTQSPRTRIKTTFAHKNLPSPQYFIFPTPPPVEDSTKKLPGSPVSNAKIPDDQSQPNNADRNTNSPHESFAGIEKQLSLEEEIPMIDDSNLTDDIEFRYSKIISDLKEPIESSEPAQVDVEMESEKLMRNKSFEDIKKELMADIPELDQFERELREKTREKFADEVTENLESIVLDDSLTTHVLEENENLEDVRSKYESLREERRKYVSEIHEIKCKMTEIRSQEDDILRELEMEKALIKGEYDSEIAILNIEQKKKVELADKAKRVEEDMKRLKQKQEAKQNEMRDRVEIATLKVERIEKDLRDNAATVEELQNAQDILDNETKIYEDLEFQHLEEESEMLAYREDLQNEIIVLTKKIETQKSRILNLKAEANSNLTSALDETKILQAEYVRLLNQVEELTGKVQTMERELKPLHAKLNDIDRTQSPDSAFYTDQTRTKSGEFGYSPQSSDSDDIDLSKMANYVDHRQQLKDKFNSIDQMSQSMIVDIERRDISDLIDDITIANDTRDNGASADGKRERQSESPSKSSSSSKEKKGFWERNFDSLSRLKKEKKPKSPPAKVDVMSQSLNENMFYNSENIETECGFDKFNSLRLSKGKKDKKGETATSKNGSSKIPTFAALGKIMKRDSFGKRTKENGFTSTEESVDDSKARNRYVKNAKPTTENKYAKAKSLSPDKCKEKQEEIPTVVEVKEEIPNQKGHNVTFGGPVRKNSKDITNDMENFVINKYMHRKSCGDEPGLRLVVNDLSRISDSGKIPSQDDIDRISKVTLDAPILGSDADMNSLGRRTLDSLMEIERKRVAMLEEQGCQVIENEREKISELKRRVQDEARKLWDQKTKSQELRLDDEVKPSLNGTGDPENPEISPGVEEESQLQVSMNELSGQDSFYDREPPLEDSSIMEDQFNMSNSIYEESAGMVSSSIEELQTRDSRTDSLGSSRPRDDGRPLSHASDTSRERTPGSSTNRAGRRVTSSEVQRPLTRYLPVDRDDFDLRRHIETAGHQVELCPHVVLNSTSCRGYLHKLGAKFHTWSKRWFVFDRDTKTFVYYWDKSERKPRGGAYFQVIEEVYLDHGNQSKSPNPQNTFVVKTRQRRYYLMSPSGEAARIWIDVIFTGAQGYNHYLE